MKSRITRVPADNKTQKKKEEEIISKIAKDENVTIEELYEIGIIDENTKINIYPKSARNVINHDE